MIIKAEKRVLLPVKRFDQRASECAYAATAALANYYDPDITYADVRKIGTLVKEGLYTSQQAMILNKLGFESVAIVCSDTSLVDYSWVRFSRETVIKRLKRLRSYKKRFDPEDGRRIASMIQWLSDYRYDNTLIIDRDFGKHIRSSLNRGRPVGASFNFTTMFKYPKRVPVTERRWRKGDIYGTEEYHAVVIRGYDSKGVFVADSHSQSYKGRLAKYRNGYYKMPWERFLINMDFGDLILV